MLVHPIAFVFADVVAAIKAVALIALCVHRIVAKTYPVCPVLMMRDRNIAAVIFEMHAYAFRGK